MTKFEKTEELACDYSSEQRVGLPAGVFLLEGSFHVAVHGTHRAMGLLDRGALLVADLVFEPSHAERLVSGGSAQPFPVHFADAARIDHRGAVAPVPRTSRI